MLEGEVSELLQRAKELLPKDSFLSDGRKIRAKAGINLTGPEAVQGMYRLHEELLGDKCKYVLVQEPMRGLPALRGFVVENGEVVQTAGFERNGHLEVSIKDLLNGFIGCERFLSFKTEERGEKEWTQKF